MNKMRIYALGFFDGVHLGHQTLLQECIRMAAQWNAEPSAITFDRHPQALFTPQPPVLINTNHDRDSLLRHYGIRHIHRLAVTKEVMSTSWQDFLAQLLSDGPAGFVCGDDFRFGHRGEGNADKLRQFCEENALPCVIVPEQSLLGRRISSTHIRNLIEQGNISGANQFLGHRHVLSGEVVPGRQLGRTIGVPTANLLIPEGVVVPKLGVYACLCRIGGRDYAAVTNIGSRPSIDEDNHVPNIETHIIGYHGWLYDRHVTVAFRHRLRDEIRFSALDDLKAQIARDIRASETTFHESK